jgi:hypothetical protein
MIQPLSSHVGLLQPGNMSSLGGTEKPGEAENDGDGDTGRARGATVKSVGTSNLSSFLGAKINTLA